MDAGNATGAGLAPSAEEGFSGRGIASMKVTREQQESFAPPPPPNGEDVVTAGRGNRSKLAGGGDA